MSDVTRLEETIARLALENSQLRRALESRVVIEQAKGILAERYGIPVDEAFGVLRNTARAERLDIRDLARRVVAESVTPPVLARALAPDGESHVLTAVEPEREPPNAA